MLKGMLMALFAAVAYGLVYLAYGKEGMRARKENGIKSILSTIIMVLIGEFYALLIGLWPMEKTHDWYEYAFLIAVPVAYILFVIYARNWSKKFLAELQQKQETEAAEKQQQLEKKKQKEEQEIQKRREAEQRKQALIEQISLHEQGQMKDFIDKAASCTKIAEVLELWDTMNPLDNEINKEIREEIEKKRTIERMYGSNPHGVKALLEQLAQTYGAVTIEQTQKEEAFEEQQSAKAEAPITYSEFLKKAADCQRYADLLQLFNTSCPEETEFNIKIREEIQKKVLIERMYGVVPRSVAAFVEQLAEQQ